MLDDRWDEWLGNLFQSRIDATEQRWVRGVRLWQVRCGRRQAGRVDETHGAGPMSMPGENRRPIGLFGSGNSVKNFSSPFGGTKIDAFLSASNFFTRSPCAV